MKMIKRKYLSMILAVCLSVSVLVGCGNTDVQNAGGNEVAQESQAVQDDESEAESSDVTAEGEDEEAATTDDHSDANDEAQAETDTSDESIAESTEPGFLTAKQIADEMVIGWNLGNTLDAHSGGEGTIHNDGLRTETCWGNPKTSQEIIDYVKSNGFNVIRVPVTWYNHMDPNTLEIDPEWMARVHEVVDYALDDNTYVILNVHHDTGVDGWLKASDNNLDWKKEVLTAIWEQVATSFCDYSDHLLFEGFNEILNDSNEWSNPDFDSLNIVNDLNQIFVDTVRATGGDNQIRTLVVNTYCAGSADKMIKNFKLPTDSANGALMVEVHSYTPYYFTAPEHPTEKTWDEGSVQQTIRSVATTFHAQGVPVIIGEFGAVDKDNTQTRVDWVNFFVTTAKDLKVKCIWWDNGITKEFGIIDRNNLTQSQPEICKALIEASK